MVIGDDVVPMAANPAQGDQILDDIGNGDVIPADYSATSSDEKQDSAEEPGAVASNDSPSEPERQDTEGDGAASPSGDSDAKNEAEHVPSIPTLSDMQESKPDQELVDALLPGSLALPDEVLPTVEKSEGKLSDVFDPHLALWGAPHSSQQGYLVSQTPLNASFVVNGAALAGGSLGGAEAGDALTFSLDLPYAYASGTGEALATTLSEEEWRLRSSLESALELAKMQAEAGGNGQKSSDVSQEDVWKIALDQAKEVNSSTAPRVVLVADDVPQGYSVWQRHGEGWQRLGEEELKAGVSGRVVFRYEGYSYGDSAEEVALQEDPKALAEARKQVKAGAWTASSEVLTFTLQVKGDLPEGQSLSATWGYDVRSYTDAQGAVTFGMARRAAVDSIPLAMASSKAKAAFEVMPLVAPEGWSAHVLELSVPEQALDVTGANFAATYPGQLFDAERVVAWDVTAVDPSKLSGLNPIDEAAAVALGAVPYEAEVSEKGQISVNAGDKAAVNAGDRRLLYLAVPWEANAQALAESLGIAQAPLANEGLPQRTGALYDAVTAPQVKEGDASVKAVFEAEPIFTESQEPRALRQRVEAVVEITEGVLPAEPDQDQGTTQEGENAPTPSDEPESDGGPAPDDASAENDTDAGTPEEDAATPGDESAQNEGSREGKLDSALCDLLGSYAMVMPLFDDASTGGLHEFFNPYPNPHGSVLSLPNSPNIFLVQRGKNAGMTIQLERNGALYLGNREHPMEYKIVIPFLYEEDGQVKSADTLTEYAAALGKATSEIDYSNIMRLSLTPSDSAAFFTEWDVYMLPDKDSPEKDYIPVTYTQLNAAGEVVDGSYLTQPLFTDNSGDKSVERGLTGTFVLRYRGANGQCEYNADSLVPNFNVRFLGKVPENSSATVSLGGTLSYCVDGLGNEHEGKATIAPGQSTGYTQLRYITFIKSNLQWDTSVKVRSDVTQGAPYLWEPINYMVYEVKVRNTSDQVSVEGEEEVDPEEEVTPIDMVRNTFQVSFDGQENGGVRRRDLMAFYQNGDPVVTYDDQGNVLNDLTEEIRRDGVFIGKPNEGGALIYKLDDLAPEGATAEQQSQAIESFWNNIDLIHFENIGDYPLSAIPYQNLRNDGFIQFLDEEPITTGETRTYLVAVPYTTNLKKYDANSYIPVSFQSLPTIYFGGKGLEGFQWTLDRKNTDGTFRAVKTSMTMDKKAWDEDNPGWKSLGNAPLGYPSQYRLSGFSTTGNVYVSGIDDGLSYGPYISEDLPENYEINAVDFRIERNANGTNPANTMLTPGSTVSGIAGLNNWFDADHNYLEFEICSQNRYDSWITSNSKYWVRMPDSVKPQYQGTVTEDGKTYDVWRLGGAGTADDLTSVLEQNGFSAKVRNTAITSGKPWFTGNMRILFANKLQQNISVPVQVVVQGTMRKPSSDGPAGFYQNKATLISGAPTWVPPINVEEKYRGHWGATPSQVVKTADLDPKGPVEPGVHAFGYSYLNNGLTWGKEGGLKAVALDQDGGGVLFALTNDCTSMMEPGVLTTSRLSENHALANGGNAQDPCGCQYHHAGDYDPETDSFFASDGWKRAGHEGFIPSHVVLSPELLKHMDVAKLTLHSVHEDEEHGGSGPVVLTRSLLQQYVVGANGATQAVSYTHLRAHETF